MVSFIGDSTFFHSGITGLVNAVFNRHNLTLVILDNGTTAMTGHQPNPGVEMAAQGRGEAHRRVSIEAVVRGVGVEHVTVIKPFKVKKSIAAIKEALDYKGVSVIISEETCTLYARGLKLMKKRAFRVSDKCVNHRDCINEIACVVESAIIFGETHSTIISDGEADLLLGFEPAETLRALGKCNRDTLVITNLAPTPPFTVAIGKGVYPDIDAIQKLIRAKTARLIAFDAVACAHEAGNVMAVNMVLLGALIQTGALPITAEQIETTIRTKTKAALVEVNLKAFELGMAAAAEATRTA